MTDLLYIFIRGCVFSPTLHTTNIDANNIRCIRGIARGNLMCRGADEVMTSTTLFHRSLGFYILRGVKLNGK